MEKLRRWINNLVEPKLKLVIDTLPATLDKERVLNRLGNKIHYKNGLQENQHFDLIESYLLLLGSHLEIYPRQDISVAVQSYGNRIPAIEITISPYSEQETFKVINLKAKGIDRTFRDINSSIAMVPLPVTTISGEYVRDEPVGLDIIIGNHEMSYSIKYIAQTD